VDLQVDATDFGLRPEHVVALANLLQI